MQKDKIIFLNGVSCSEKTKLTKGGKLMRLQKKRILFLILTVCAFMLLNSCSNNTESINNDGKNIQNNDSDEIISETPGVTENIYEQFPKIDFEGRKLNFLITDYLAEEHRAEEEIGEIFNDAVFRRNKKIEDDYNINFSFIEFGWNDAPDRLRRSVLAGDNSYDLASMHAVAAAGRTTAGIYSDWRTVPVINENLDNHWWNRSVVKDLSIGNKCFFIAGDISYLYIAQNHGFIFNKKLFRDAGMDIPYKTVKDGNWTYSIFSEMLKGLNTDLNGDGVLKLEDDLFGFTTMSPFADTMYFYNFGGKIVEKDVDDYPVLVLGDEKNAAIIQAGYDWFIGGNFPLTGYTGNDDYSVEPGHRAFMEDRIYFLGTNLKNLRVLRNMESEYGILPYPKFNESQENYISNVEGAATMLVLPPTADGDFVGTIVEALARESSLTVIPAYYETTLQQKFARDEETIDMVKIIRDTASFDMGYIYNIGGAGFISTALIGQKSANLASWFEKNETVIQRAINQLIEYCKNLN